jgi:hypothetical protein
MLLLTLLICVQIQGPEIKLTPKEKIPGALLVPVVFSHDGSAILYFKQSSKDVVYALADENGKPVRDVFTSTVDIIDLHIASASGGLFSPDGKRLAALATRDDKYHRAGDPVRAVIVEGEKALKIDARDSVFACTFAGEKLLFIEQATDKRAGYRLRAWDGAALETIHESTAKEVAMTLRASPDGLRAAFLVYDERMRFRLRVIDLKMREVSESETFATEDVTFNGPPLIFWDSEGKGIYFHRTPGGGDRKPWAIEHYDVATKKSETLFNGNNLGIVVVLDKDFLAAIANEDGRGGLVRLSDRKFFPLGAGQVILGATAKRLVVGDAAAGEVRVCEYERPK